MKFATFIFALVSLLSVNGLAGTERVLNIASFPFPPLLHESTQGSFSGTMGETVKVICEKAKIECQFTVMPLKRAYQLLEKNKTDGLITIKTNQFEECCLASQWQSPWVAGFFSKEDQKSIPDTADGVLGKSLIIVNGMRSPFFFMPKLKEWSKNNDVIVYVANDIASAIKMFNSNRAELLWGSDDFNWYFDKLLKGSKYNFSPLVSKPVVLWLRKEKQSLMDDFNKAYVSLLKENKLSSNYLLIDDLMKQRYIDAPYKVHH